MLSICMSLVRSHCSVSNSHIRSGKTTELVIPNLLFFLKLVSNLSFIFIHAATTEKSCKDHNDVPAAWLPTQSSLFNYEDFSARWTENVFHLPEAELLVRPRTRSYN